MNKRPFFRVAVEGETADGREIKRSWLEQIVKNFNLSIYAPRVWLEHHRSIYPDGLFRAYGDVLAVRLEEQDLGDGQVRAALFAQIEPTKELILMNRSGQKVFSSIEINTNFANSGEAYLVGLAVTDSPASLGTERLKFSNSYGTLSPDVIATPFEEFVGDMLMEDQATEEQKPCGGENLTAGNLPKTESDLNVAALLDAFSSHMSQMVRSELEQQFSKVFGDGNACSNMKSNEQVEGKKCCGGENLTAGDPPMLALSQMVKAEIEQQFSKRFGEENPRPIMSGSTEGNQYNTDC